MYKQVFTDSEEVRMEARTDTAPAAAPNPDVISAYEHGWRKLWKQFLELLLIMIVSWVLSFVFTLPTYFMQWWGNGVNPLWGFLSFLYTVFVLWPVNYGVSFAYLKAARGEKVDTKDMFAAFRNYGNTIVATLLTIIIVVVGFIFFIIPGIFFLCKLAFVPYLVVDKKMDAIGAIKASWNSTGGYGWQVFLIGLLAIPIMIAGFIVFGVGAIIASMWISTALASLYYAVESSRPAPVPPSPDAAAPPTP